MFYEAATNAIENLTKQKIASGFGFWNVTAGFDIGQRLIEYTNTSTYGRAFWVGFFNTLLVPASASSSHFLRLHHRHCAPLQELARPEDRDNLRRSHPQHPAAAAAALLVQRRSEGLPECVTARRCRVAHTSTIVVSSCRTRPSARPSSMSRSPLLWAASATGFMGAGPRSARMRPASRRACCPWLSGSSWCCRWWSILRLDSR